MLPNDYLLRLFAMKDGLQFYCLDEEGKHVTSEDIGGLDLSFQLDRRMSELFFTMWAQSLGIQARGTHRKKSMTVTRVVPAHGKNRPETARKFWFLFGATALRRNAAGLRMINKGANWDDEPMGLGRNTDRVGATRETTRNDEQ
ncbi:hypothetical protein GGX14DRAFT_611032 [Mycena pura]|uniref:Uncharacterized protein n=1 Tax=Mycena pura TaxID=153505 RepID=A0AAD6VMW2_9AGAR|nr:hypothetical protein GGX14DRAFT_611032 [Mycena pura]